MSHLVLKLTDSEFRTRNGFQYPNKVQEKVFFPDFKDAKECGNGFHGFLNGEGDLFSTDYYLEPDFKSLVIEVPDYIELDGKVKFKEGTVVFIGTLSECAKYIKENVKDELKDKISPFGEVKEGLNVRVNHLGTAIAGHYGTAIAGFEGTAKAGDFGTAKAGYKGTAIAGVEGTANAGDYGTAIAGYKGTAIAGVEGTANAGDYGTATAGFGGTAFAGFEGTANAGDYGTATAGFGGTAFAGFEGTAITGDYGSAKAGYNGTAIAGDFGTAKAGYYGTVIAGFEGTIMIKYYDDDNKRFKTKIGYIGEDGLKPNTKYKLDKNNNFQEVV